MRQGVIIVSSRYAFTSEQNATKSLARHSNCSVLRCPCPIIFPESSDFTPSLVSRYGSGSKEVVQPPWAPCAGSHFDTLQIHRLPVLRITHQAPAYSFFAISAVMSFPMGCGLMLDYLFLSITKCNSSHNSFYYLFG